MHQATLVDAMFKQSGVFREGRETQGRLMDSMDLERALSMVNDNVGRIGSVKQEPIQELGGRS